MKLSKAFIKSGLVLSVLSAITMSAQAETVFKVTEQNPIDKVFEDSVQDQLQMEPIFLGLYKENGSVIMPKAVSYATCNKLDTNIIIVTAALTASAEEIAASETLGADIANAARDCKVTEEDLLTGSIAANVDPTKLGEATAAGGVNPNTGTTGQPTPARQAQQIGRAHV